MERFKRYIYHVVIFQLLRYFRGHWRGGLINRKTFIILMETQQHGLNAPAEIWSLHHTEHCSIGSYFYFMRWYRKWGKIKLPNYWWRLLCSSWRDGIHIGNKWEKWATIKAPAELRVTEVWEWLTAADLFMRSTLEGPLSTLNSLRTNHLCSNSPNWKSKTLQLLSSHYSSWLTRTLLFKHGFMKNLPMWTQIFGYKGKSTEVWWEIWQEPWTFCIIHLQSNQLLRKLEIKVNWCRMSHPCCCSCQSHCNSNSNTLSSFHRH